MNKELAQEALSDFLDLAYKKIKKDQNYPVQSWSAFCREYQKFLKTEEKWEEIWTMYGSRPDFNSLHLMLVNLNQEQRDNKPDWLNNEHLEVVTRYLHKSLENTLSYNDELAQFVHCNQTEGRNDTSTTINTVNEASPSLSILTANMTTNIGYVQKKRRNSSLQSKIVTTTNEAVWKNPTEEIVEDFRLYREWWLTTDCGVKIHNIKLSKIDHCTGELGNNTTCKICLGISRNILLQTEWTSVTTEEDTLDIYRQEYERFYRFRNHLAINRYYAENDIIPRTFNFEIPVQTPSPLLRKRWEQIASDMRKAFLQCKADAIQKTIDETRLKLETLRDKILKMKKEQQMLDIERGASEFLSDFIEKAWNKVFRLEMKEKLRQIMFQ
ncbi:unnamed protein product [Didymodactylos carnosus]|uniref:Uncharacterized protein n=1 Tax=Didymodactylos carnosus TaxID=1234261 RepID=A0A815VXH8_9BILA|nr:unnamed protein product [Didymodactylos carnosus]CAF1537817.1 unnamed protein product [Didymodactylos carnosus]CAF3658104.1 unnamed protein product [Didymodactylos carnosus]CAF4397810.1 unnamed protein product [Didymodactylos carnosus]